MRPRCRPLIGGDSLSVGVHCCLGYFRNGAEVGGGDPYEGNGDKDRPDANEEGAYNAFECQREAEEGEGSGEYGQVDDVGVRFLFPGVLCVASQRGGGSKDCGFADILVSLVL